MVASILLAGPIPKKGGVLEVCNVYSGTTQGWEVQIWPKLDPDGFTQVETVMLRFTDKAFSVSVQNAHAQKYMANAPGSNAPATNLCDAPTGSPTALHTESHTECTQLAEIAPVTRERFAGSPKRTFKNKPQRAYHSKKAAKKGSCKKTRQAVVEEAVAATEKEEEAVSSQSEGSKGDEPELGSSSSSSQSAFPLPLSSNLRWSERQAVGAGCVQEHVNTPNVATSQPPSDPMSSPSSPLQPPQVVVSSVTPAKDQPRIVCHPATPVQSASSTHPCGPEPLTLPPTQRLPASSSYCGGSGTPHQDNAVTARNLNKVTINALDLTGCSNKMKKHYSLLLDAPGWNLVWVLCLHRYIVFERRLSFMSDDYRIATVEQPVNIGSWIKCGHPELSPKFSSFNQFTQ
ncbi:hypothetical protein CERSUDRAFT_99704 [Gelatoporia subvermispora B]|uniref:Uncharacterized protein n=1 Tax=Ceriporiopsis subvermispora (strain B) TaxID=914234 RepID=M2PA11_CERS8|nr:hypothetical protein CERSUDRAFT_99704 [Gelatoporia subvermispora B]